MRHKWFLIGLLGMLLIQAASGAGAQEAAPSVASESDRALLRAAAANLVAAESGRVAFSLALQLDGTLAQAEETALLKASGHLDYNTGSAAWSLETQLALWLPEPFSEQLTEPLELTLALAQDEGELRIALEKDGLRFQVGLPLDPSPLDDEWRSGILPFGRDEEWFAEWRAELAEFRLTLQALLAEHGELWRLPDNAGDTVLQATLDGRQVLLDPGFTVPLMELILGFLADLEENGAGWGELPLNIGPLELAIALGFLFRIVDEADVKATYVLVAERETLRALALDTKLTLNLALPGVAEAVGILGDAELGALRLQLSGKAHWSD